MFAVRQLAAYLLRRAPSVGDVGAGCSFEDVVKLRLQRAAVVSGTPLQAFHGCFPEIPDEDLCHAKVSYWPLEVLS
jgi:hypothetical protein